MPDWLIGGVVQLGTDLTLLAITYAVLRLVHRAWGVRGLAWILGKSEAELRQGRPAERDD